MEPVHPTLPDTRPPSDTAAGAPASVRPTLPDETPAPPKPARRPRRAWLIAAASLLVVAVIAAIAHRPLIAHLLRREASRLGFDIDFDAMELSLSAVRLRGVKVGLTGVRGLKADVDALQISLAGLSPERVEAEGVAIDVVGSAADRLLELSAWSSDHPDIYRIPGAGSSIRVAWSSRAGSSPWLALASGVFTATGSAATFSAANATLEGVAVRDLHAEWSADPSVIAISAGVGPAAEAQIKVDLRPGARPPVADVTLRPMKLSALGPPLGTELRAPGAVVEGTGRLTLGTRAGRDAIKGEGTLVIKGFTPPHPRQLDPLFAGNTTALTVELHVSEDRKRVSIPSATVTTGSLKLNGKGSILREEGEARVTLDLNGKIPCSELLRSAASSDLGDLLGQVLGDVAQQALKGAVDLHVHVEADTRDLRGARVEHQIGVGCGIQVPKLF